MSDNERIERLSRALWSAMGEVAQIKAELRELVTPEELDRIIDPVGHGEPPMDEETLARLREQHREAAARTRSRLDNLGRRANGSGWWVCGHGDEAEGLYVALGSGPTMYDAWGWTTKGENLGRTLQTVVVRETTEALRHVLDITAAHNVRFVVKRGLADVLRSDRKL